ncbi:MAG TPA: TRAP transporter small permease [Tepidisphaeraceae bacterium]|nr:TRAP transporter small permease [Tepidisphaeraceae bacterium]
MPTNTTVSTTSRWRAAFTRSLEWACITMMAVMILDVIWGVLSRFVFRSPSRWTDELATFMLIWIAMLGAALAHRQASHLGVSWLIERIDPRIAGVVARFIHVLIIGFAVVVMVYGGALLVQDRFRAGQVLPGLGWSKAWMYLAVPVAGVFIIGYSLHELIWPTPRAPLVPAEEGTGASTGGDMI